MKTKLVYGLLSAFLFLSFYSCNKNEEFERLQKKVNAENNSYNIFPITNFEEGYITDSLLSYNDSCRITIRGISKEIVTPFSVQHLQYDFWNFVSSHPRVVVDFGALWSGPWKMLSPILEETAIELNGIVIFGKIDVDENPGITQEMGIRDIPTVLYFKNGQYVYSRKGYFPKNILLQDINRYLL